MFNLSKIPSGFCRFTTTFRIRDKISENLHKRPKSKAKMAPNILLFEKYGAQNDMKCFFWRPLLFGFFFQASLGEFRQNPSHPPKFTCSCTYVWEGQLTLRTGMSRKTMDRPSKR